MKKWLLILSMAGALSIHAQTPTTPSAPSSTPKSQVTPTTRPTTQPGTVTPPPGSSVTVTPNPNNPNGQSFFVKPFSNTTGTQTGFISNKFNFSNQFSVAFSNTVDTNANIADTNAVAFGVGSNLDLTGVDALLASLQSQIDQSLAVLVSLTGGVNANAGGAAGTSGNSSTATIPATRTMPATPTAQSLPRSPTMPLTPGSGSVPNVNRGNIVGAGPTPTLPATGEANQRILAQSQIAALQGQGVLGTLGTNTLVMNPQTFRVLAALQNNLQQAHLLLRTLNVSQAPQAQIPAQAGVGFTNLFVTVTNNLGQGMMTPTGR